MPTIIRRLPFVERVETLDVPGGQLILLPDELTVWVSIIPPEFDYDPAARLFPAILDTGTNHNLVMRPDHFSNLAGYELSAQTPIRDAPVRGRSAEGEAGKKETASVPKAYDFTLFYIEIIKDSVLPAWTYLRLRLN